MDTKRGLVIGLAGKFGSGKDTAAALIQEAFPEQKWRVISFARLVKQVVATLTSTTLEQNLSDAGKQTVPRGFTDSLSTLQQKVGMAMRSIDEQVWIKAAFASVAPEDNVIITDVRFPNELRVIHEHQGMVIRLFGRPARPNETRDPNHISETALDAMHEEMDAHLENSGTLEDLRKMLIDGVGRRLLGMKFRSMMNSLTTAYPDAERRDIKA